MVTLEAVRFDLSRQTSFIFSVGVCVCVWVCRGGANSKKSNKKDKKSEDYVTKEIFGGERAKMEIANG
jgi:hypothetical protein